MAYEVGVTKFVHRMWGEGILREESPLELVIEFFTVGTKRMTVQALKSGVLSVVQNKGSSQGAKASFVKQYDASPTIIGGKNVLDTFEREETSIFNESYILVGSELNTSKITAAYDLTVLGDVEAEEISVNGDFCVVGNLKAQKVVCQKTFICRGEVHVDNLYVGGDLIADSVRCSEFSCDGNALVRTVLDIDGSAKIERTTVACEGIIGAGQFSALNAIANEYFEFTGPLKGKILELESSTTLSEIETASKVTKDISFDDTLSLVEESMDSELLNIENLDEDAVLDFLQKVSEHPLCTLVDAEDLFQNLIKISYEDEIVEFGNYLIVLYAQQVLPEVLYRYETVEHIYSVMLPKAKKDVADMDFEPETIERFALALKIVEACGDELGISSADAYDKIFGSIGLRYQTVQKAMKTALYADLDKLAGTNNNARAHQVMVKHGLVDSSSPEYQRVWREYWWKIR